ncbi:MAG TPA: IS481 family transposase [Bryobacteraceae bacterium]|nr:IS481 family transposase [Bryobacteraceae bacterium]
MVEERLQFVVRAHKGASKLKDLCREFGISRQTGHLWLKRYRNEGSAGMKDRSRRPLHSPKKTAPDLESAVVSLRQSRPDWGAAKLARMLAGQNPPAPLPARTVHRILERNGLIAEGDRRRQATQRFQRANPNELWQMDFKGLPGTNRAPGPLSVIDDCSRYIVVLRNLGSTALCGVKESLTEAFQQNGMPEGMLMDHGMPWWSSSSAWGLTELSVWLMRLGIRLSYSGIRHPQTQGKVERMHGALQKATNKRQGDLKDQAWLDEFRHEYNAVRPHEALNMATPASVWSPSQRRFPDKIAEWQYGPDTISRTLENRGRMNWRGRTWDISYALRDLTVGIEVMGNRALVYFCRTPIRELNLDTGETSPLIAVHTRTLQT